MSGSLVASVAACAAPNWVILALAGCLSTAVGRSGTGDPAGAQASWLTGHGARLSKESQPSRSSLV